MTSSSEDWYKANYSYLLAKLNKLRQILEQHHSIDQTPSTPQTPAPLTILPDSPTNSLFRLDELRATFELGAIERDILLTIIALGECVGEETQDSKYARLTFNTRL